LQKNVVQIIVCVKFSPLIGVEEHGWTQERGSAMCTEKVKNLKKLNDPDI
jgi:hypothetical protein